MRRRMMLSTAALAVLTFAVPPGAANAEPTQVISDAAGDANFLNAQSNFGTPPNGPSTKPASIDGADLRSISIETRYTTHRFLNPDGSLSKILYNPQALIFHVTMEGPIQPTVGPSMLLRIPTRVVRPSGALCETWFEAFWRGSRPAPGDLERADIRRLTTTAGACPAVDTLINGFDVVIEGNKMKMIYPLTAPNMAGFLEEFTVIQAPQAFTNNPNYVHVRLQAGAPAVPPVTTGPTVATVGQIDEAERFPGFTVGQDVPADVHCDRTPDHPECQSS